MATRKAFQTTLIQTLSVATALAVLAPTAQAQVQAGADSPPSHAAQCQPTIVKSWRWVATANPHVKQAPSAHPVAQTRTDYKNCKPG